MKIKINKYLFLLTLIILLNLNFFYLFADPIIKFSDLAIIVELVFMLVVYTKYGFEKPDLSTILFLFPIVLAITSSLMANRNYQQPFRMGIYPQRSWLVGMLMFFPIKKLLSKNALDLKQILKILDWVVGIYIVVLTVQYLLGNKVQFLDVLLTQRYGGVRIYANTNYLVFIYILYLSTILEGKKIKAIYIFYIISTWFVFVFITKSRMSIIALALSTLIMVFFSRFSGNKLFSMVIIILGVSLFFNTPYGKSVYDSILGNTVEDAGSRIRDVGRTFYLTKIAANRLNTWFGVGYVNTNWDQSVLESGYSNLINYNDNGIFGMLFYYGYTFVIWMLVSYFSLIVKAINNKRYSMIIFMLYGLFGIYTLLPGIYAQTSDLTFVLCAAIIWSKVNDDTKLREFADTAHYYGQT